MDAQVQARDNGGPDFRLPTLVRSIMAENRAMLLRRWRLAKNGLLDSKLITRWFPEQKPLLDILGATEEEEQVVRMADCTTALFTVTLPPLTPGVFTLPHTASELEKANADEIFMALLVRVNGLHLSTQQAIVDFCLSHREANRMGRFGPHELRALACDPMMHTYPIAADAYFIAAATKDMTQAERTVLATVSRRARPSIR